MNTTTQKSEMISSGVENLIKHLREDGVAKGQSEAERIVAEAHQKAEKELADAKKKADAYFAKKEEEANALKAAAEEDIRSIYRDSLLKMKEDLSMRFANKIQSMVSDVAMDKDVLSRMVLEVTHKQSAKTKGKSVKDLALVLPNEVVGLQELRKDPELMTKDAIGNVAMAATADLLKDGVTIMASEKFKSGIKVQLVDEKIELDLSDYALTEMFMEHLQPRFRAILEGAVK